VYEKGGKCRGYGSLPPLDDDAIHDNPMTQFDNLVTFLGRKLSE
jgi:hypothetical protein